MALSRQKIDDLYQAHKRLKLAVGQMAHVEKIIQETVKLFKKYGLDESGMELLAHQAAMCTAEIDRQASQLTPSEIPRIK